MSGPRTAWLILAFALVASPGFAASVRIVTVEEPPSSFKDAHGGVSGFAVDVVRLIQEKVGDDSPIEIMPEKRAYQMASTFNNVIFFSFSRTPERENLFNWITLLMKKPWTLYAYSNKYYDDITLEEAKSVKVGVVHGDVRETYVMENGFKYVDSASNHLTNIKKLMARRIDLIFYEPQGLAYECKINGLPLEKFTPVLTPYVSDVYVAMSKNGTNEELVDQWKQAAQRIKEDGSFLAIARKWSALLRLEYGVVSTPTRDCLDFTR